MQASITDIAERSSASTEEVSASTEQPSASTSEITSAAGELAASSVVLNRLVAQFKTAAASA